MSRNSLLLLAAVILLNNSMKLFIWRPVHGAETADVKLNEPVPGVSWCRELRWRSPPLPNAVALASYPGSGNTWLRYLLQQATGIVTGSIYLDLDLQSHGFPAENVKDGSVLVVKTHKRPPQKAAMFNSAILLIRNPRDAMLAEYNRKQKGHTGTAPKSAFMMKDNKIIWEKYVSTEVKSWEFFYNVWLTTFPGPVHIVFYKALVRNTKKTLEGILKFLNNTVSEAVMTCALLHKEGIYKRKEKHQEFDPFTLDMYKAFKHTKPRDNNCFGVS